MIISSFQFGSPYFLFLIPLALLLFVWSVKRNKKPFLYFSSVSFFQGTKKTWRHKFSFFIPVFRFFALVLLIIALARPQWGQKIREVTTEGIDIILAIDTSGSMRALDFKLNGAEANRLDVIKKVVKDFIFRRPYDRVGMVIFGDQAYTQSPLTTDGKSLVQFLDSIEIGMVGEGTAIGNALALSCKRLKDRTTKSKIIILLTDGADNSSEVSPDAASQMAKDLGIKVYTIGVGSVGPVLYPQKTPYGTQKIYAQLDMDEPTLQKIAKTTDGQYFKASNTQQLEKIYETIDKLEKTEIKVKEYSLSEEWFFWFVGAGLIFLILERVLKEKISFLFY